MKSTSMRDAMSHYERLDVGDPHKNYDYLVSLVRKRLEQARRDQNRDEFHNGLMRRGRSLAAARTEDNPSGSEGPRYPKGVCRTWHMKGACPKGDTCPFSHDREQKGKGGGSPHSPKRKDSPSPRPNDRGSKVRSKSPPRGSSAERKVCQMHLKGSCKKGEDCALWHSPVC